MTNIRQLVLISLGLILLIFVNGQTNSIKKQLANETPPDNISKEQRWWNVLQYNIEIIPNYESRYIAGTNSITFSALEAGKTIQIDLQEPMRITKVIWKNKSLMVNQNKTNTYLLTFPTIVSAGEKQTITVSFEGKPKEALKPPFDNGWIWAKDIKGRPWMSVACEGSGASIWLPCKDVLYDEPDNGISMSITVPDTLAAVGNGRLQKKTVPKNGTTTYLWKVISPINNYNIIPYIGKYVYWHENYAGLKGNLDCDFWVLDYSLDKAKKHFKQTDTMLQAFEYWLGPYPFYEDSYKLVEAPMPGMEHQSAVAYGNGFQNGYQGKDFISASGWGLKWDFMLVHESGHEWFGNSITARRYTDSWIHEGFTKYLEALYTSYVFGVEAGNDYAIGTWKRIKNDKPVLSGNTSDYYYKAGAMLHMLRQIVGDTLFRIILIRINNDFYHQTVDTRQILATINSYTKTDLTTFSNQYLETTQVPRFSYTIRNNVLQYRWENCVKDFSMPVRVTLDGKNYKFIFPSTEWQKESTAITNSNNFKVDRNFYISVSDNK